MIHIEHHGPVLAIRMARSLMGRPLQWTAAYWVDGVLIDTGPRCTADELLRVLKQVKVECIVVTHGHEDCTGGLAKLRERYPQVAMYAPHHALRAIEEPDQLGLPLYRQVMWGRPQPVTTVRSFHDTQNVIRTPSYTFRVIDTPGHCRDHVSLYEPTQRWVFSGDVYIAGSDPNWARDEDLFGVMSSLQTLASLRPERLFCGSGSVHRTPLPDIHGKISWLSRLAREVAAYAAEGLTEAEMVDRLFAGESSIRFWTGGYYSAANLIQACQSYNALVSPGVDGSQTFGRQPFSSTTTADSADSSTSQSADLGDIVR